MTTPTINQITFFFFFFVVLFVLTTSADSTTVVVNNAYAGPEGKFPMNIQCTSVSDDRGVHFIPWSISYSFDVTLNGTQEIVYQCHITASAKEGTFMIYNSTRDIHRCPQTCNWDVAKPSIMGYPQGSERDDVYFNW